MGLVLLWHGDRELDTADLLLSELHLGATYDAIVRRRLWRRMPFDVLAMPLAIVVATYALVLSGWPLLVTTTVLYLGAWHRGRQNLGIARYYQRRVGGPVSSRHRWLLRAAFYLPMVAGVAYYTSTAPTHEGEPFHGLSLGPEILWGLGAWRPPASWLTSAGRSVGLRRSVPTVGLDRTLGARCPSRRALARPRQRRGVRQRLRARRLVRVVHPRSRGPPRGAVSLLHLCGRTEGRGAPWSRSRRRAPPARPVRGVAGDRPGLLGGVHVLGIDALLPFLTAGLLGHYWLDGRIWTARARRLAPA